MISVLTLVKNRGEHLDNLVEGLRRSSAQPAELVIVDMSDRPVARPRTDFPVKLVPFATEALPLAQARNLAAATATADHLLFMDVDCIPASDLVGAVDASLRERRGLICADVRYLAAEDTKGTEWSDASLKAAGVPHPARPFPVSGLAREPNYALFWSVAFGISRDAFRRLSGFDERFTGYGAEDTDFAFRARKEGLDLLFLGGANAYHQHHAVFDPPLNHFADIIRNARIFREIWGFWPMDGWLDAFVRLGFVTRSDSTLTVIASPSERHIASAKQPPYRRF